MRAFVFPDASLTRHAGRYVWLSIDTEKARNASVSKRLRVYALPTFFVVDPRDEQVALRWVGGATVPQFLALLDHGTAAMRRHRGLDVGDDADRALARADSAFGAGADTIAVAAYQAALASAPANWSEYGRAVESLLFALDRVGMTTEEARLAHDALPRLRTTGSAANVAASGLGAALSLPKADSTRAALVAEFEGATREILANPSLDLSADDRSGMYAELADARDDAGDSVAAHAALEDWARFLEGEAARAKTPDQRAVFDSHRLSAYIALHEPEHAIPMLEASERDLPRDYNPSARLAVAYKAMKRWDEALAASDRALAKAYGPRKLGILQTRSDIYVGRGDVDMARKTLDDALAFALALPDGQRFESQITAIQKKLDGLSASAGSGSTR